MCRARSLPRFASKTWPLERWGASSGFVFLGRQMGFLSDQSAVLVYTRICANGERVTLQKIGDAAELRGWVCKNAERLADALLTDHTTGSSASFAELVDLHDLAMVRGFAQSLE